jgi:hypothetical protein
VTLSGASASSSWSEQGLVETIPPVLAGCALAHPASPRAIKAIKGFN